MSAHEHEPDTFTVSLEGQDGRKIDVSRQEFYGLIRAGSTILKCPACDETFTTASAEDLNRNTRALFDHAKAAHGYSEADLRQANIVCKVVPHCPRCHGPIPPATSGKIDGEGPGRALSRTSSTEPVWVCEGCGTNEAYESMASGGTVTPRSRWPIRQDIPTRPTFRQPTWDEQRSNRTARPNMPPTPREVPDLRLHLMERWLPGGMFDRAVRTTRIGDYAYSAVEALNQRNMLAQASLWWVRPEMVQLTTAAAPTIPGEVTPGEIDLPAGQAYGLAVLGETWMGLDAARDEPARVDAIVWSAGRVEGAAALSISFYQYIDFTHGLTPTQMQEAAPWLGEASHERIGARADTGETAYRLTGGAWTWLGRTDWPATDALTEAGNLPVGEGAERRIASMVEDRRWFAALCVLVNHRLSHVEPEYPARQTRRRAERAGVKGPSTVRIVRLREAPRAHGDGPEDGEHRTVEWSHRWMVGAHTGWRRCGPGRTQRRLAFISPHVKGPADKPLIIKDTVRVWRR